MMDKTVNKNLLMKAKADENAKKKINPNAPLFHVKTDLSKR